jgi:hypothetical protein
MMLRIALIAMLLAVPAKAGTVTCAGKTYADITYARVMPSGNFEIVRLWTTAAKDDLAHVRTPKFAIILNSDAFCEMQDVPLQVISDSGIAEAE